MTADTVSKLADAIEMLIAKLLGEPNLQPQLDAANAKITELEAQIAALNDPALQAKADKALSDAAAATPAPVTPPAA